MQEILVRQSELHYEMSSEILRHRLQSHLISILRNAPLIASGMRAHIFPHHLKKIYYLSTSYHLQELNVLRRESNKAKFKGENEDLTD